MTAQVRICFLTVARVNCSTEQFYPPFKCILSCCLSCYGIIVKSFKAKFSLYLKLKFESQQQVTWTISWTESTQDYGLTGILFTKPQYLTMLQTPFLKTHPFSSILHGLISLSPLKKNGFKDMLLFLVQFISVTKSRPTLCDPMDCSTSAFSVQHYS